MTASGSASDFDLDAMLMDQLLRHERGLPEIPPDAYLARSAIRTAQAQRFWDLGVGREIGFTSLEEYLNGNKRRGLAPLPQVPEAFLGDDPEFNERALIETRISLKRLCELGDIAFNGDDKTFVAYDRRHAEFKQPTWICFQDGRKNRNRSVSDCRKTFAKHERGLTALQGVCTYLQHPTVVSEWTKDGAHVMDLSGSVHREGRGHVADLDMYEGRAELRWHWYDSAGAECGSASRREC